MDENEALVGELRRYLNSAQKSSISHESEQVQALKRDLNLAARVGQQLLMQLRQAEKDKDNQNNEISKLRAQNREILLENQRLAAEHGVLIDSVTEQEQQISQLIAQLSSAQQQADKLARATASARALEREVELLEQVQADLRQELESKSGGNMIAESLVARRLAESVESELKRLKLESGQGAQLQNDVEHASNISLISVPSLTMGAADGSTYDTECAQSLDSGGTPKRPTHSFAHTPARHPRPHNASTPIHTPRKLAPLTPSVAPNPPAINSIADVHPFDVSEARPKLRHARSHESVLSLIPSPPTVSSFMAPRMAAPSLDAPRVDAPEIKGATSDSRTPKPPSSIPVRSAARDKLSQVRGGVEIRRPERRWAFTPFRM